MTNEFITLHNQIKGITVVSPDRCFMIHQFAKYSNNLEGNIAEVGVFRGGTSKLLAKTCPNKQIHLFDTFKGMPDNNEGIREIAKGTFAANTGRANGYVAVVGMEMIESVKAFLQECDNVVFHKGYFPDTSAPVIDEKFSFVYIDGDLYQTTKDSLEFFYPRMVSGGIMMLDDWQYRLCPGVERAVNEFLEGKNEVVIQTTDYQAMIIKY